MVVLALAIMTLVSIGLGWLFAGRVLSPVRSMTAQLQQISARNLHERLAVTGPDSEIKELADTIDSLLARLEVALEGHKRFVANAAHELRTPLTVEHALLEEPLIDPDADVQSFRQNFHRLLVISEQRARLLESLLTLSGSEHGRDQYQELDLARWSPRQWPSAVRSWSAWVCRSTPWWYRPRSSVTRHWWNGWWPTSWTTPPTTTSRGLGGDRHPLRGRPRGVVRHQQRPGGPSGGGRTDRRAVPANAPGRRRRAPGPGVVHRPSDLDRP